MNSQTEATAQLCPKFTDYECKSSYSQVDILGVWHKPVNFWREQEPGLAALARPNQMEAGLECGQGVKPHWK